VSPTVLRGLPDNLLQAICLFIPGIYYEYLRARGAAASEAYLSEGLGFSLHPHDFVQAEKYAQWAAPRLARSLGETPHPLSSAENVLLALPLVEPRPTSADEAVAIVHDYWSSVVLAEEESQAYALTSALAVHGKRYVAMTEVELPIGAPALLRIRDERPLYEEFDVPGRPEDRVIGQGRLSRFAGADWFSHRAVLNDARSYHMQLKVADQAAEFDGFRILDSMGNGY
jgi:hypothetical protein